MPRRPCYNEYDNYREFSWRNLDAPPADCNRGGSIASTVWPPSGKQVLAARQVLLLPRPCMAARSSETYAAPSHPCDKTSTNHQ